MDSYSKANNRSYNEIQYISQICENFTYIPHVHISFSLDWILFVAFYSDKHHSWVGFLDLLYFFSSSSFPLFIMCNGQFHWYESGSRIYLLSRIICLLLLTNGKQRNKYNFGSETFWYSRTNEQKNKSDNLRSF